MHAQSNLFSNPPLLPPGLEARTGSDSHLTFPTSLRGLPASGFCVIFNLLFKASWPSSYLRANQCLSSGWGGPAWARLSYSLISSLPTVSLLGYSSPKGLTAPPGMWQVSIFAIFCLRTSCPALTGQARLLSSFRHLYKYTSTWGQCDSWHKLEDIGWHHIAHPSSFTVFFFPL